MLNNTFCSCFSVYVIFSAIITTNPFPENIFRIFIIHNQYFKKNLVLFFPLNALNWFRNEIHLLLNYRWRVLNIPFIIITTTCLNKFYRSIKLEGNRGIMLHILEINRMPLNYAIKKKTLKVWSTLLIIIRKHQCIILFVFFLIQDFHCIYYWCCSVGFFLTTKERKDLGQWLETLSRSVCFL